jgi:hypothetical protein
MATMIINPVFVEPFDNFSLLFCFKIFFSLSLFSNLKYEKQISKSISRTPGEITFSEQQNEPLSRVLEKERKNNLHFRSAIFHCCLLGLQRHYHP